MHGMIWMMCYYLIEREERTNRLFQLVPNLYFAPVHAQLELMFVQLYMNHFTIIPLHHDINPLIILTFI